MNRFVYTSSYHKMPYIEKWFLYGNMLGRQMESWELEDLKMVMEHEGCSGIGLHQSYVIEQIERSIRPY